MISAREISDGFREIQDEICGFLRDASGDGYVEDSWRYGKGDGGGVTRVWEEGGLIEKGGVNFSAIEGAALPQSAATKFQIEEGTAFFATGVSLVIHPWSPHIPTIHMNVRFFEAGERWWFGGGVDLTPSYPVLEQVQAFHRTLRDLCAAHGEDYAAHKAYCDRYFYLPHRDETRGVGGLFFDHLNVDRAAHWAFVRALGRAFPALYGPIIEANRPTPWDDKQREFQLYRRGRYVEFNLAYDRGTRFGLESGGRAESILMSLPLQARWRYNWRPEPRSPEAELTEYYHKPRDWLELGGQD